MKSSRFFLGAICALTLSYSLVASVKPAQAARATKSKQSSQASLCGPKHAAMAPYLSNLKMNIASNWRPPSLNKSSWGVVYFELDHSGALKKPVSIIKSGSVGSVDKSVVESIDSAAPFGTLPGSKKRVGFRLAFHYYPDNQAADLTNRQYQDLVNCLESLKAESVEESAPEVYSTVCTFIAPRAGR